MIDTINRDFEDVRNLPYVPNEEVRDLFNSPNPAMDKYPIPEPKQAVEVDDITGLPIAKVETILSKYGKYTDPDNSFHQSLNDFFTKAGFLTAKQLSKL